jgi:tRNA1Val (adenine37-N6)-methyltransferase
MRKIAPEPGEDETLDSFYHGRVRLFQKKAGYRFSVDAPLLADFIRTRPDDSLLELGAGNGVISLLLSVKPFARVVALELQPGLAELARRNVRLNGLEARIAVLEADVRTFKPLDKFDVVFSNPPYIRRQGGHLSLSGEKSIAKHEIRCDISDIMQAAAGAMKRDGRACFVYPAARRGDFDGAREKSGLRTRALRLVHSRPGEAPRWMLAECDFSAPEPSVQPPLFVYGRDGRYTLEMERIFRGESREALPE